MKCSHKVFDKLGVADWCGNCGAVRLTGARVWISPELTGTVGRLVTSMQDGIARKDSLPLLLAGAKDL